MLILDRTHFNRRVAMVFLKRLPLKLKDTLRGPTVDFLTNKDGFSAPGMERNFSAFDQIANRLPGEVKVFGNLVNIELSMWHDPAA